MEEEANKRFIDAAIRVKARRFVYLSVLNADTQGGSLVPHFAVKGRVEKYLRDSGIPWVILRPCAFQESLLQQMMPGNIGTVIGKQHHSIRFVGIQDIALVASSMCQQPGGEPRVIQLFGPQALTYDEAYSQLSLGWGRRVPVLHLPLGLILIGSAVLKWADPFMENIAAMFAYLEKGGFSVEAPDMSIWKVIGREPSPIQTLGERLRKGEISAADYRVFP